MNLKSRSKTVIVYTNGQFQALTVGAQSVRYHQEIRLPIHLVAGLRALINTGLIEH